MTAHGATHEVYHMPSTHFNALSYSKKLKAVGVSEPVAEVHAEALAEIIDKNLATKHDIWLVRKEIKELENEIKNLESGFKHNLGEMEKNLTHKLTIRLGGMIVVGVMVLGVLQKIL